MVAAFALLLTHTVAQSSATPAAAKPVGAATDAAGLAAALAAQNGGQAVVALTDGRTVNVSAASGDDLTTALKANNVRLIPGIVAVAHSEVLPNAAIQAIARLRKAEPTRKLDAVAFPATAVNAGKVTYASEVGKTIQLSSLQTAKWSLPLLLSPAYTNTLAEMNLAVNVKDVDEAEFLRSVAKAIGGRYRTDGKNILIEASGGELKNRALRAIDLAARTPRDKAENAMDLSGASAAEDGALTFNVSVQEEPRNGRGRPRGDRGQVQSNPATYAAQLDLARAVTTGITSLDFEKWLDGTYEAVTLNLAGQTGVQNALIRLLRANATAGPDLERVNRLLASVPPRSPGQVVLSDGYSIEASLNTVDRRGNASRAVRLKAL